MGILGRLWGWCREPKTKLQKLRLLVGSSRAEGVVLPLLFDIGILLFALGWFLSYPSVSALAATESGIPAVSQESSASATVFHLREVVIANWSDFIVRPQQLLELNAPPIAGHIT